MPTQQGSLSSATEPAAFRRWLWWGLAAVALVVGYADLWRGGETLAPVLLVIAYCVLVPVAILKR
jgi:hypothetical protein